MSTLLTGVDAWVTAVLLAVLMAVTWEIGRRRGVRLKRENRPAPATKFSEATLALLGLLLAFTFSMALGKHDQRRLMLLQDSNAIGDFYTCASLLKEPVRGKLQGVIRKYVQFLLTLAKESPSEERLQKGLDDLQAMHGRMQTLVGEGLDSGTPVATPLVNTLNEVTSSHAARLSALRDRLYPSIVLLLFLAALVSMAQLGMYQGSAGELQPGATFGFVVLVSMVVWVTLDLNQPQRGLITVSQEPLQRLLSGMGK
jgi:hypothetical protein